MFTLTTSKINFNEDTFIFRNYAAEGGIEKCSPKDYIREVLQSEYFEVERNLERGYPLGYIEYFGGFTEVWSVEALQEYINALGEGDEFLFHFHGHSAEDDPIKTGIVKQEGVFYAFDVSFDEDHLAEINAEVVTTSDVVDAILNGGTDEWTGSAGSGREGTRLFTKGEEEGLFIRHKEGWFESNYSDGSCHILEETHTEEQIRSLVCNTSTDMVRVVVEDTYHYEEILTFIRLSKDENKWTKKVYTRRS